MACPSPAERPGGVVQLQVDTSEPESPVDSLRDSEPAAWVGELEADASVLYGGPQDRVGARVVAVPDRDGDGRPELAASSSSGETETVWILTGVEDEDRDMSSNSSRLEGAAGLGVEALGSGDFDDDGVGDLLVGVPFEEHGPAGDNLGWVGLVDGSVEGVFGLEELGTSWVGPEPGASLGLDVSGLGDRDGDGVDDLAMSASGEEELRVYLLAGGAGLAGGEVVERAEVVLALPIWSPPSWGLRVFELGDVSGDGLAEVVVGYPEGQGKAGELWILPAELEGAHSLGAIDGALHWTADSELGTGFLGLEVVGLGDYDGDGQGDLGLSAQQHSRVYVVPGGELGEGPVDSLATLTLSEGASTLHIGNSVAGMDVDEDGTSELFVGTMPFDRVDLFESGLSGTVSLDEALLSWELEGLNTHFGAELRALGELTDEGRPSLAASAMGASHAGEDEGLIFLF